MSEFRHVPEEIQHMNLPPTAPEKPEPEPQPIPKRKAGKDSISRTLRALIAGFTLASSQPVFGAEKYQEQDTTEHVERDEKLVSAIDTAMSPEAKRLAQTFEQCQCREPGVLDRLLTDWAHEAGIQSENLEWDIYVKSDFGQQTIFAKTLPIVFTGETVVIIMDRKTLSVRMGTLSMQGEKIDVEKPDPKYIKYKLIPNIGSEEVFRSQLSHKHGIHFDSDIALSDTLKKIATIYSERASIYKVAETAVGAVYENSSVKTFRVLTMDIHRKISYGVDRKNGSTVYNDFSLAEREPTKRDIELALIVHIVEACKQMEQENR